MDGNGAEILGHARETNDVCDVLSFITSDSFRMSDKRGPVVRKNVPRARSPPPHVVELTDLTSCPFYHSHARFLPTYPCLREPFIRPSSPRLRFSRKVCEMTR